MFSVHKANMLNYELQKVDSQANVNSDKKGVKVLSEEKFRISSDKNVHLDYP